MMRRLNGSKHSTFTPKLSDAQVIKLKIQMDKKIHKEAMRGIVLEGHNIS